MIKVLITGCAGYIGSVLTGKLLGLGYKVIGVDNFLYGNASSLLGYLGNKNFEFHELDVQNDTELAYLAKFCDTIIPLAALVGAPICEHDAHSMKLAKAVNYVSIKNLINMLSPLQRVIFPNTNSGYGTTDPSVPCTEDSPLEPISHYGKTKCAAEKEVLEHPNSVSLRLATVFGVSPRMRFDLMVNDFVYRLFLCDKAAKYHGSVQERLHIFEPHYMRNFVGIKDVCEAFIHMATKYKYNGIYNLGLPNANLSKLELAYKICDTFGYDRDYVVIGHGKDPDQRNYFVSSDKIMKKTNFGFYHTLEEGIKQVNQVCQLGCTTRQPATRNHCI